MSSVTPTNGSGNNTSLVNDHPTLLTAASSNPIIISQDEYASATSTYKAFYDAFSKVIADLQSTQTGKNTDQAGTSIYTIDRANFELNLKNLISTYFPTGTSVPPAAVIYPPQTAGAATASGKDWASVQQFAIQMGYIKAEDQTSTPPTPLPAGIASLGNGKYAVTVDRRPLDHLLAASQAWAPLNAAKVTLTADEYAAWQTTLTNQIGKQYGGTDIEGSVWQAINKLLKLTYPSSTTVADILAKTYIRLDKLQTDYLNPYLNILQKHNDFDAGFTASIVDKMTGWTSSGTIAYDPNDDENLTPCTVFNRSEYQQALNDFFEKFYGSNPINPTSLKAGCILYPPQSSSSSRNGVTWETVKAWAVNAGYLPKNEADQLQSSVVGTTDYSYFQKLADGTFVLIEKPTELLNLMANLPHDDEDPNRIDQVKMSSAQQQTFNTTFNDNKAQIAERGTLHAQDAQRVHSDYNNQANINSSIDKSLMDTAASVINNFR